MYVDGPRNSDDVALVRQVIEVAGSTRGFAKLDVSERGVNAGLAASISEGFSQTMAEHGRAIVVGDDIVTSPAFLRFMNPALKRYADVPERLKALYSYRPQGFAKLRREWCRAMKKLTNGCGINPKTGVAEKTLQGRRHRLQDPVTGPDLKLVTLDSQYGARTFHDDGSLDGSTVFSAGPGEDASLDVEFAARFSARVVIVDPTPRATDIFISFCHVWGRAFAPDRLAWNSTS